MHAIFRWNSYFTETICSCYVMKDTIIRVLCSNIFNKPSFSVEGSTFLITKHEDYVVNGARTCASVGLNFGLWKSAATPIAAVAFLKSKADSGNHEQLLHFGLRKKFKFTTTNSDCEQRTNVAETADALEWIAASQLHVPSFLFKFAFFNFNNCSQMYIMMRYKDGILQFVDKSFEKQRNFLCSTERGEFHL